MASGRTTQALHNYLLLLLNNTAWANIGDASGLQPSAAAGSFYISLHTGNPGVTGDQTTSEAAYTGYLRIAVARTTGGFTVTNAVGTNAADINFVQATGGSESETYVGLGTSLSGAGHLVWFGQLTTPLSVSNGITPVITAGTLTITAA